MRKDRPMRYNPMIFSCSTTRRRSLAFSVCLGAFVLAVGSGNATAAPESETEPQANPHEVSATNSAPEPQPLFGGGGTHCTGAWCESYAGGAEDNCDDCRQDCPEESSWSTRDYGSYAYGNTVCETGGHVWEVGEWRCRSDEAGVICKDCGGCFNWTSYCDW